MKTTTFANATYEELGYDAGGNVTSLRKRDGSTIVNGYDDLGRLKNRTLPSGTVNADPVYGYDLLGRLKTASASNGQAVWGTSLVFDYDALGRLVKQTSAVAGAPSRVLELAYDEAGRRTQLTWPESGFHIAYDYRLTDELWRVRENGATSGVGVLASYAYDNLGRRTGVTRGNGTSTSYAPDGGSRLTQLAHDLAGTSGDVTTTLGYDGLSRIKGRGRSNDAYALAARAASSTSYLPNVLNQYQQVNGVTQGYDLNGNTTFANGTGYGYNALDQLVSAGAATLAYDPLGRLAYLSGANVRFETLGSELIDEVSATGAILRRYVHGPGIDEPIVWYEGSGASDRRWLHADERGSVVAISDGAGTVTATNRYDEYGNAEGSVTGRFGYTGQMWLPETGLYSYKARMYSAQLGRFLQTDPISYAAGMNLYAYVAGDPVNYTDPTGTCGKDLELYTEDGRPCEVVVIGGWGGFGIGGGFGDGSCGTLSANAGFLQECIGAGGTAGAVGRGPAAGNVGEGTAQSPQGPPICTVGQEVAQAIGNRAMQVGRKATQLGDKAALAGILAAGGSAALLNPAGVLIGGLVADAGVMVSVAGRSLIGGGAALSVLGGRSIRSTGTQVITDWLPFSDYYKDKADRVVDSALNWAGVPDRPRCRRQ